MKLLLTGGTGKVGQEFLQKFLAEDSFSDCEIVALCHNRVVAPHDRIKIIRGSISEEHIALQALAGITHVVHMAAVKESPDIAMDVSVKGMFWLLEAARKSLTFEQFILISGDCSVGHIFQQYHEPITELSPRKAYPGCYALSKLLEEVMLEQYQYQYNLNGCCLRAPWIMEKDDFKHVLKFDETQFGGPEWTNYISKKQIEKNIEKNTIPLMLDINNDPLKRNFIHISDLAKAIIAAIDEPKAHQQLFNISMDEPINYAKVAKYLNQTRKFKSSNIKTNHFSNWLDNRKARHLLNWAPEIGMEKLIEGAFTYQRKPDDPRVIWYPG
ncbi:MAG: NAD(P)-dependent oxidoreductase [Alphaproteobacteria bacterium]|nr:NAD(P)-dependent oxidoreductase [Alphaproteobacteria bacterium]